MLIVWVNWIGSLFAGWEQYYPWLVVPPTLMALTFVGQSVRIGLGLGSLRSIGNNFTSMLSTYVAVIAWNTVLNIGIFGIGYAVSHLFKN